MYRLLDTRCMMPEESTTPIEKFTSYLDIDEARATAERLAQEPG